MGWRELSDDAQHLAFWITSGVGVILAISAGVYWNWWTYAWNVPPPVRGVLVINAAVAVFVLWWFLAQVTRRYFGWPERGPFDVKRPAKATPPDQGTLSGEEVTTRLRLAEVIRENEQLRAAAAKLATVTNERDGAMQAFETCKRQLALTCLKWQSEQSLLRHPNARITIRSAGYEDFELVETIENLFKEFTPWPVTPDPSNDPLLRPDENFKVVFVAHIDGPFAYVANHFEEGRLLSCAIGRRLIDKGELGHLVVEVLPTTKAAI